MSAIAAVVAAGTSPNLLAVAAHEIGHALAFRQAGIPVRSSRVWLQHRQTDHWRGTTEPADKRRVYGEELHGWQVVLLAGEAATYRCLRRHLGNGHREAQRFAENSAAHDLAAFRGTRDLGISLAEARTRAAALVDRHGGRIDRLTVLLVTNHHLSGSAL